MALTNTNYLKLNLPSTPITGYVTPQAAPKSWGNWKSDLGSLLSSAAANAIGGGGNSSQPKQSSGSFWNQPGVGAALVGGGMNLLGGTLSGKAQSDQTEAARAQQQAQFDAEMAFQREKLAQDRSLSAEEMAFKMKELDQLQAQFTAKMAQDSQQFNANLLQNQGQFDETSLFNRQKTGLEATQLDPLAQQKSRQGNAVMANIMGNARNITAPTGVEGFRGGGGMRIPEGGFGADVMDFYSPESRANAEGEFYKNAAPFMEPTDLTGVGYGAAGAGGTKAGADARRSWYDSEMARKKAQQSALMGALDPSKSTIPPTANRSWLSGATKTAKNLLGPLGYQRKV